MASPESFVSWYRKLWNVEDVDGKGAVAAAERELGVSLPPLLRDVYLSTSLRGSQMIHLKELGELEVQDDVLVFATEQQGCFSWGIELDQLTRKNLALVADPRGEWQDDGCSLEDFLRYFALVNRPYEAPSVSQVGFDERLLKKSWVQHEVKWRSLQHASLWTNGEAVIEAETGDLGARDLDALRRAAKSLDVDPEELEDLEE